MHERFEFVQEQAQEAEARKRKRPKAPVGLGQLPAKKKKGTKGISSMIDKWQAVRKEEVRFVTPGLMLLYHRTCACQPVAVQDCLMHCTVCLQVLLAHLNVFRRQAVFCKIHEAYHEPSLCKVWEVYFPLCA